MIGNVIQSEFLTNLNYPLRGGDVVHPHGSRCSSWPSLYARVLGTEDDTSGAAAACMSAG